MKLEERKDPKEENNAQKAKLNEWMNKLIIHLSLVFYLLQFLSCGSHFCLLSMSFSMYVFHTFTDWLKKNIMIFIDDIILKFDTVWEKNSTILVRKLMVMDVRMKWMKGRRP